MVSPQTLQMGIPSTMNDDFQLTLKQLFDHGLTIQPNETLITRLSNKQCHTMTNKQFQSIQPQLASSLSSIGFKCGDIAASFMWNTPRHLSLLYTIPNMGGCLLPLNLRLHPNELSYIITHSSPTIIFIDANLLPAFRRIPSAALSSVKHFIICGDNMQSGGWSIAEAQHLSPAIDFDQFVSSASQYKYEWPNLSHKSGAFLFYTSGTTGAPKGIVYSHRSVYLAAMAWQRDYHPSDTVLMSHPFFHILGAWMPIIAMQMGFRSLFNYDCYVFDELLDFCLAQGATQMGGVPTFIVGFCNALTQNPQKYKAFRGKLKFMTGGSAIPGHYVSLLWNEWGIEVRHVWGMSECIPGSAGKRIQTREDLFKSSEEQTQNVLKQGIFNPLLDIRLVDPEDANVEKKRDGKEVGELLVRGPCATRMYFRNKEATAKKFVDGEWLKTGDICTISDRKVLRITDRSKDLIKSGGEWISSIDMENHTMKLNEVELACVVGVPHSKWRERPVVIVKLKPKVKLTKETVLKHIGNKFARFQIPDDVIFWNDIPLSSTGKLSKKDVREMLKKQKYQLPDEQTVKRIKSKL
eukprot:598388_1